LHCWFLEGKANIFSLRFIEHDPDEIDFTKLFIDSWDGKFPNSEEFFKSDGKYSYFFATLFTSFISEYLGTQIKGQNNHQNKIDLGAVWLGYDAFNTVGRNPVEFELDETTQNGLPTPLGLQKIKQLYRMIGSFIQYKSGQTIISFDELMQNWDTEKKDYFFKMG